VNASFTIYLHKKTFVSWNKCTWTYISTCLGYYQPFPRIWTIEGSKQWALIARYQSTMSPTTHTSRMA